MFSLSHRCDIVVAYILAALAWLLEICAKCAIVYLRRCLKFEVAFDFGHQYEDESLTVFLLIRQGWY